MRHYGIKDIKQAADPRYGYVLGRMLMDGTVNEVQHEAGIRYAEDCARYYGLTGIPFPSARAQNLFAVHSTSDEVSQSRADRAKDARDKVQKLQALLLKCGDINTGRRIQQTVKLICVEDVEERRYLPPNMALWLKQGLNKLAEHYLVSSLKE